MALFSRTPSRKPAPKAIPDPRAVQHSGVTGAVTGFSLSDAAPTCRVIEVSQVGEVLGVALENAVLLFASGHPDAARDMLAEGIDADPDTSRSQFAWLVLFDLLQRAGDRDAYESLALRYVLAFECTAPLWDESAAAPPPDRGRSSGYVGISGTLNAHSPQLRAVEAALADHATVRLDLAGIADFDDAGALALAKILAEARQQRSQLELQRPESLHEKLASTCQLGREGGEGAWTLDLELLQWRGDEATFDERAIDYAVTFEVSPPSWEPPAAPVEAAGDASSAGAAQYPPNEVDATDSDVIAWSGVIAGGHPEVLDELAAHATRRARITLDMTRVERIDFAAAGACFNAIQTLEGRGESVRIVGATPVIQAILRLLGLGPDYFERHHSQP